MTDITPTRPASPPLRVKTPADQTDLREMAQKFEASFLTPMVEEMLKTSGKATFGAGNAEEVWRSVLAGAIAQEIAETDSTGIAAHIARQMAAYRA